MKNMELKEKLVALRKEKGLTQSAVAEKLDVSRQAISRWESGIALPSTDNLKSLSALYGVEYSARDCAPQPLKLSIHSGGIEHPCRCR